MSFPEAINNLNEYKNQEKRVIEVGEFEIQVQSTCSLVMPPTPVIHPVELECLTGHLEGELIAKAIVKLSGETPQPGDMVVAHMAECELIVEKEVNTFKSWLLYFTLSSLSILLGSFVSYYIIQYNT